MAHHGNQDGTWLALGVLVVMGVAGSGRGESRSRGAGKRPGRGSRSRLSDYLFNELGPSLAGRKIGRWNVDWEFPGNAMVWRDGIDVAVWATPGWEGDVDRLVVQISRALSAGGEDHFIELATERRSLVGTTRLWTGDLATDAASWERLVRPVLEALDAGMTPQEIAAEQ